MSILPNDAPQREKVRNYQKFVEANEAKINKAKVKFVNEFQAYLVATQDIEKGEDVLSIPYPLWMPLEMILQDSPIALKLNDFGDLTNYLSPPWRNSFFGVFFAEQKKMGDKSKFKDYI